MANAQLFYGDLISGIKQFIAALENLTLLQDRMVADSTLAASAAAAAVAGGRTDLATVDFNNVSSAIVQLNFTFNSGTPTQKSYLYKLL